jgi:hypothetical protein
MPVVEGVDLCLWLFLGRFLCPAMVSLTSEVVGAQFNEGDGDRRWTAERLVLQDQY